MNTIQYYRVVPWGFGSLRTKLPHTETCGVIATDGFIVESKVKVNGYWLSWYENECRFKLITKEEFETDLSFGLWPQLKVKYTPRLWRWFKQWYIKSTFDLHTLIFPCMAIVLTVTVFVIELYVLYDMLV